MPYTVVSLPNLIPTSSGSTVTNGIGHLDDASSITLYFSSSYAASTTAATIQVSQFDPADPFPSAGTTLSSNWYVASSSGLSFATTNSNAIAISNISFKGLRIGSLTSANGSDVIAFATKQMSA